MQFFVDLIYFADVQRETEDIIYNIISWIFFVIKKLST